jgi:hypothetical protein
LSGLTCIHVADAGLEDRLLCGAEPNAESSASSSGTASAEAKPPINARYGGHAYQTSIIRHKVIRGATRKSTVAELSGIRGRSFTAL